MKCDICGAEFETDFDICPACGREKRDLNVKMKICPQCNVEVNENSKFCNKCGWNFATQSGQKQMCPKCGEKLKENAKFCDKCGYNLSKKKRKAVLPIIIVLAIILGVGVSGTAYYMHQKAEKEKYEAELEAKREAERKRQDLIHTYQSKAIELYAAINGAKKNFDVLSTMFSTSTEMNAGFFGPSYFTSYVEGLCSSEITTEKSRKREIDDIFEELGKVECDEEEIQELKSTIEDYYYAYCDRYDLLVNINFTVSNFSSKENTDKTNFNSKFSAVQKEIGMIDKDTLEGVDETEEKEGNGGGTTI